MTIEQFEAWQARLPSLWDLMGPREKWNYIARRQKCVKIKVPSKPKGSKHREKSQHRVEVDGVVKYKYDRKGRVQVRDRSRRTGANDPDNLRRPGELIMVEIESKFGVSRGTVKVWVRTGTLLCRRVGKFSFILETDVIKRINKSKERRIEIGHEMNRKRGY